MLVLFVVVGYFFHIIGCLNISMSCMNTLLSRFRHPWAFIPYFSFSIFIDLPYIFSSFISKCSKRIVCSERILFNDVLRFLPLFTALIIWVPFLSASSSYMIRFLIWFFWAVLRSFAIPFYSLKDFQLVLGEELYIVLHYDLVICNSCNIWKENHIWSLFSSLLQPFQSY